MRFSRTSPAKRWRGAILLALVLGALGAAAWLALRFVPLPRTLFEAPSSTREYVDRNGQPLRKVRPGDAPFERSVSFSEIPPALLAATLAAEDKRFWDHSGVDVRALARATWGLLKHRRIVSGASTITMQLIKLAEPRRRSFKAKMAQAVQALRLEQVWDKQRILAAYLSRAEYGNLNTGVAEAACFYFAKPLRDLTAAECAFLAGLPQAPTRLNPLRHIELARRRQRWILGQMREAGFLGQAEYDRAVQEPLRLASPRRTFEAPHFVDLILAREDEALSGGRGRIRTTLDLALNRFVAGAVRSRLAGLRSEQVRDGAVVVIDNRSGDILALVGSADYFAATGGQVNGAWAPRSAGSTFKPFTYLIAFERGATPATVVADVPVEFATATGLFSPVNYSRHCHGPVRCRLALANSLNIPAVRILAAYGGPAVLHERLCACGLTTLIQPAEYYGLGLTLGNAEARLLELAGAYACLARLGEFRPYHLLLETPFRLGVAEPTKRRVFEAGAAYLVADVLADNAARALSFGVDSSLRFEFPVACKTGTSSDFRDNWAFGYTPEFTVGVWVGNVDGTPMERVSGVTGAAPILHEVFVHLHERFGTSWFAPPAGIVERRIHPLTGKALVSAQLPSGSKTDRHSADEGLTEKFVGHTLPPLESAGDYDEKGRVRLGLEYRQWLNSPDNWLGDHVVLAEPKQALNILSPISGTVFYLDPGLPDSSRRIPLRADGGTNLLWECGTLVLTNLGGHPIAELKEGRHCLMVRNRETGENRESIINVTVWAKSLEKAGRRHLHP